MAYNYDYNPWDDSPASSNNNGQNLMQQQQAGDMNYGSYSASTGYNEQQPQVYGAQQQQDSYLYQNSDASGLDQSQQQPQGQEPQSKRAGNQGSLFRSLCGLVGCGPLADTLAAINLPFIDRLVQNVNRDLLISKLFYFFFYSAFGSLFPLMGVYFKQLGMNPGQVGILTGVRPFIEIFSAPFWHSWAERFQKSKALLLFSLLSWICFTYSLAIIKPPASACVAFNDTDYVLYTPYSANDLSNFEVNPGGPNSEEAQNQHEVASELISDKSLAAERESKDAILASEETPTDQGRRRRKRQADYSTNDNYGFQSPSGDSYFVGDLEKDFDDRLVGFERNELGSPIEGSDRRHSAMNRYKRNSDAREPDDLLGESDAPEPEEVDENEIVSHNKNNNAKPRVEQSESGGQTDNYEERARNQPPASPSITTITTSTTTTTTPEPDSFTTQETKVNKSKKVFKQRHKTPPTHIVGMSPITVEYAVNYNKEKHSKFVTPMFSTIVYKLDDIKEVFFLLLLLISLGEFFSAPALTLADSATLSYLGENTDLYGRQRLFGSLSWAITLLLVGMALDNATSFADHPCGPHQRERSYTVCFMIFSLLMGCALLTATQFRFDYKKGVPTLVATADGNTTVTTIVDGSTNSTGGIDDLYASTQPRSIFNTAPPVNAPSNQQQQSKEKFEFLDKWKSAVFAQNTKELPEWVNVFRQFKNSLHLTYLFITWFLGCGVGLVFTFLFWHLQDVGGTPTLFGICSVINHISEIMAYFFSFGIIKRFGHTKVLSVGLGCNVIRFLYVAFLTNPYYALPFELVQGITHAACFAACCSYISHESKPELKTSTQGVMQGLHHGIGRACGALIGGYMIGAIGSRASFCIYGLLSGCVLAGFLYVRKRASEVEDSDIKVDESEALGGYGAPQGVPSAIPVQTNTTANVSAQGLDYQW